MKYTRAVPLVFLVYSFATRVCLTRKLTATTTEIPTPFQFKYAAGRAPGGKPDRYVEQEGDADGNIRGSYTYLDPNWKWQRVNYEASEQNGFQILPGSTSLEVVVAPKDTLAVQKAKAQHEALYEQIAASHQIAPIPYVRQSPSETVAVQKKRYEHESEYQRIAAEHAQIEAQHASLAAENARLDAELAQLNNREAEETLLRKLRNNELRNIELNRKLRNRRNQYNYE